MNTKTTVISESELGIQLAFRNNGGFGVHREFLRLDTFSTINNSIFSGPFQVHVIEYKRIVNYYWDNLQSGKNRDRLSRLTIPNHSEKEEKL